VHAPGRFIVERRRPRNEQRELTTEHAEHAEKSSEELQAEPGVMAVVALDALLMHAHRVIGSLFTDLVCAIFKDSIALFAIFCALIPFFFD
jgi:hypothetical protein